MAGEQILIVEDQRTVAGAMRTRLRGLGYDVAGIASTGSEAIEKASELMPDLVLMDIKLGDGMDGIEAARQIRISLNIPIVYVSAYADHDIINRAKLTNPAGFINKPFTTKDLLTTIDLALYSRGSPLPAQPPTPPVAPAGAVSEPIIEPLTAEAAFKPAAALRNDAVVTADQRGVIIFVNHAAERQIGVNRRDLTGTPLVELLGRVHALTRADAEALVETTLRHGTESRVPHRGQTEVGAGIHDLLTPLRDAHGQLFGIALRLVTPPTAVPRDDLKQQLAALGFALEPLPMGIVVLSRRLRVLFSNGRASILLATGTGLAHSDGQLVAPDAKNAAVLLKLVEQAAARDPLRRPAPVGLLHIEAGPGQRRLEVLVVPARCGDDPDHSPAAIAYIFDTTRSREISSDILAGLYRLTDAEMRLIALMIDGHSIDSAARELDIAVNTARTHLKHVYQKTGIKRQAELLQRLERGPAGLVFKDI